MKSWPIMNFSSGPVDVPERTLRDQSRPVLNHYDPAFVDFFAHTCTLLQQVFQTRYDVIIMQGDAILALEAAALSLIAPGDKVLNLVSGVFGKGYEGFIKRAGGEVIELAAPYNDAIDPDDVRRALAQNPGIKFLSVVHSETPSATVNPVQAIGPIAQEFGVITIVDTVSGLGSELFSPEAWGMDVAIAGSQKCLSGPPGLALLAISPAAWQAMERHPAPLRHSYLSILDWKESWLERQRFPHTPSVSTVYALESALGQALEEGVAQVAARHAAIARACRAGVKGMGLELWPIRQEIAANAVTGVKVPPGIDDAQLRRHMRQKYGVMISGAFGQLMGQLIRLGHMGKVAQPAYLAAQLAILERSLADLGHPVDLGAGVGAAIAALGDSFG